MIVFGFPADNFPIRKNYISSFIMKKLTTIIKSFTIDDLIKTISEWIKLIEPIHNK